LIRFKLIDIFLHDFILKSKLMCYLVPKLHWWDLIIVYIQTLIYHGI